MHGLRAGYGFVQLLGPHLGGGVAPIEPQRRDTGILHGRRGGMTYRKSIHRAKARAC